jgi:hypothetical protein
LGEVSKVESRKAKGENEAGGFRKKWKVAAFAEATASQGN